ncbi:MAG: tetratricopeptide repeat protein [Victivallales bacterium]
MNSRISILLIALLLSVFGQILSAKDAESRAAFDQGVVKEKAGDCKGAAEDFLAAEHWADDPVLKVNAIKRAADCYEKANLMFKEFECLESLLNAFPSSIDYPATVQREYVIATKFYQGRRDPALSWMPWIKDKDRSMETMEAVLKHAPFAKFAPEMRLRLGKIYIEENKIAEAIKTFRDISKMHPRSQEAKFAEFELANILIQKARRGDGDGAYVRQAQDTLRKIIDKYPKDPEVGWAKETLGEADDIAAKRLYGLASFYHRRDRDDSAQRYLNDIITTYPENKVSDDAEEMLEKLNEDYKPSGMERKGNYVVSYKAEKMPAEVDRILIVPENSNGKWMLPIEDLGLGKKDDKPTDKKAEEMLGKILPDKKPSGDARKDEKEQ